MSDTVEVLPSNTTKPHSFPPLNGELSQTISEPKTQVLVDALETTSLTELDSISEPEKQPTHIQAIVKFIQWQPLYEQERPFQILMDVPEDSPDQRTTNLVYEDKPISVQDIRGQESKYTLNEHGFHYLKHDLAFKDYESAEAVERHYFPKVELLLRSQLDDLKKVFFFDWKLRTSKPALPGSVIDLNDPTDWLRPSIHAHVDQSAGAVLGRILKLRVRVINVWKPLRNPVLDWPLAVCDGSNVCLEELVETDHVRRIYDGSNMNLMCKETQKWFYLHGQRADEVLLIKNFDSDMSVKARWCPHVSFEYPIDCSDKPVRESIEFRALVFSDPVGNSI